MSSTEIGALRVRLDMDIAGSASPAFSGGICQRHYRAHRKRNRGVNPRLAWFRGSQFRWRSVAPRLPMERRRRASDPLSSQQQQVERRPSGRGHPSSDLCIAAISSAIGGSCDARRELWSGEVLTRYRSCTSAFQASHAQSSVDLEDVDFIEAEDQFVANWIDREGCR